METQTGMIIKLVPSKGYGFIRPDKGPTDIFFNYIGVVSPENFDNLREGHRVSYLTSFDLQNRIYAIGVTVE